MNLIEFVNTVLPIPAEYEFISYLVSGSLLILFCMLIIGVFLSVFTSIFNHKY